LDLKAGGLRPVKHGVRSGIGILRKSCWDIYFAAFENCAWHGIVSNEYGFLPTLSLDLIGNPIGKVHLKFPTSNQIDILHKNRNNLRFLIVLNEIVIFAWHMNHQIVIGKRTQTH